VRRSGGVHDSACASGPGSLKCHDSRVSDHGDRTIEQLADIAISSAGTAAKFGINPKIAMLSYSTGESGTGANVGEVRATTQLVRDRRPDLLVEGPLQFDAAVERHCHVN
jgi:phosphotransacetylase